MIYLRSRHFSLLIIIIITRAINEQQHALLFFLFLSHLILNDNIHMNTIIIKSFLFE